MTAARVLVALLVTICGTSAVHAAGVLSVEINGGFNYVVDSNVLSPSTYAPEVATVNGRICNTGDMALTGVQAYIGDFGAMTPGLYPVRDSSTGAFIAQHPLLANTGLYSFTHVGGSLGTADATRLVGTLQPGDCRVQYWHMTYPKLDNTSTVPVWGASNDPDDDLWLEYEIWATAAGATTVSASRRATMRNEISANANKIQPQGSSWFNTTADTVLPGDTVTTNGINYDLGNINQGFDNDGDLVPDYNAWLQPIGTTNWDPSCFRLIGVTGVLTINRSGGNPPTIINFEDQLYFTDLPQDNTGGTGEVHYTFLALSGPCSMNLNPYQEVASGFDNEKFNGDFGSGIPAIGSFQPAVTLDKNVDLFSVLPGGTLTYTLDFENTGSAAAGRPELSVPLVLTDSIPADTTYVAGSAAYTLNFTPNSGVTIYYSTDDRATWTTAEPAAGLVTDLRWWLNDSLPAGASGQTSFEVTVDSPFLGSPFIENTGEAGFGDAAPFAEDSTLTLVEGNNAIGDLVWQDDDVDGLFDVGEPGIEDVTVRLYWDRNGDGLLDAGDILITTQDSITAGAYSFADLPDGDFLVEVDATDADIPLGYSDTTGTLFAVTGLSGGTNFDTADFGFGPSLVLDKNLTSANPALEGEQVSFTIDLINTRPSAFEACELETWAEVEASQSSGQPANKRFSNFVGQTPPDPTNAFGAAGPDASFALADFSTGANNVIAGTAYGIGLQAGTITQVEALFRIYVDASLTNDFVSAELFFNAGSLGTTTFTTAQLNTFVPLSNAGLLEWDVTALRTWDWSDFAGDLDLQFGLEKSGSADPPLLYIDSLGFRITSDANCGGVGGTINPLPLTDTFDADRLQFVSAVPPADSLTFTGSPFPNTGVLSWGNLGPLDAGDTLTVTLTYLALEPPDGDADGEPDPVLTVNTGSSSGATFLSGAPVNPASDTASVTINPAGVISGTVWADNGGGGGTAMDGVRNGSEPGIPGVTVQLFTDPNGDGDPSDGVLVSTQTTDGAGGYAFTSVTDGDYVVVVDPATLPGSTFTQYGDPDEAGVCSVCDDDGSATIDYGNNGPANDDAVLDFGYTIPNTFFGNVWNDNDGDATQEAGENGLAGITVRLEDCGANAICGDGDDGSTLTTTTDANGDYLFSDLADGNYRVVVDTTTLPAGGTWAQTVDPDSTFDDATDAINVQNGELSGSHDFAYTQSGSSTIGDTLYTDWNGDGDQDAGEEGIGSVDILLYEDANGNGLIDPADDALIATTTTAADGSYSFTNLPFGDFIVLVDETDPQLPSSFLQTQDPDEAGACLICDARGSVTLDALNPNDTTIDFGYQPTGSASIGDTVFRDDDGDGILDAGEPGIAGIRVTLYEDDNGNGIIDAGDAVAGFADTDANGNYSFDNLPAGDFLVDVDTADADLPLDGLNNPFVLSTANDPTALSLAAGESRTDVDFGFTAGGTLGNFIFQDNDADGTQDAGEPGVPNVTVSLYDDVNGNGQFDSGTDTLIATTLTDGTGEYLFQSLPAGDYVVVVLTADPDLPSSTVTSDPDETGVCSVCDGETGITLTAGQIFLGADFGFQTPGVVGDAVWLDSNGDGIYDQASELGLANVTVNLLDSGRSVIATTVTDGDGLYTFGDLADASYFVQVDTSTLPPNLVQTFDPDEANPCSTCDSEGSVTITGGSTDLTLDFGYGQGTAGTLSITKTSSAGGGPVNPGDVITYTLSVTNTGTGPATGVAVSDPVPNGTSYVAASASVVTPVSRTYRDEFSSVAYNGSDGTLDWSTSPWTEIGDDGVVSTGDVVVEADLGDNSLRVSGANQGAVRTVDLSSVDPSTGTAVLTFDYRRVQLSSNEDVTVEFCDGSDCSFAGSGWTVLATYLGSGNNNGNDPAYVAQSFDLVALGLLHAVPATRSSSAIRFLTNGNLESAPPATSDTDFLYADDIQVDLGRGIVTFPGGDPPAIVTAADGYTLLIGETMTVTLQVQVDDPLAAGISQIRNRAGAISNEMLEPVFDLVIDRVSEGGTLGDRVWLDADGDGSQDVGEPGIANVELELYDVGLDGNPGGGDDVLVATTVTDLNGEYVFTGLQPGTYYVDVTDATVPAGLLTSPGTSDPSPTRTITAQEVFRDLDFGYVNGNPPIIGDFVWSDADGDGVQDPGEPGLGGVTVNLLDSGGSQVATTTTRADGFYLFDSIAPGDYTVEIDAANFNPGGALEGYSVTSGPQSQGNETSAPITVAADSAYLDADFGYRDPGLFSIDEGVWFDADADGLRDAGEAGIEGVTVSLVDSAGNVIATTISAADGSFSFDGLPDGTYTVQITDIDNVLSGLSGTTAAGLTRSQSLVISGGNVSGFDFGYNVPGAIGDRVWSDADGDGVQDPGESGIAGVDVELWLDDGNGVFDPLVDTLVSTTTTLADGFYRFETLSAGTYFVDVDETQAALSGYTLTTADDQAAAGIQFTVTLASDEAGFLDADYGFQNSGLADLSGNVFNDLDRDGFDDGAGEAGITGVTVVLLNASGEVVATTTTDANGDYAFPDVPAGTHTVAVTDEAGVLTGFELTSGLDALPVVVAGADIGGLDFGYVREAEAGRIGDLVWLDADRDGVLDAAEGGIADVTVELYDTGPDGQVGGGDDVLVATTTTDVNGRYAFGGLDAGTYYVDVDGTTLPAGLSPTPGTTDPSAVIDLSEGEQFFDADFGYAAASGSAIGDRIWYDLDGDGFQDPGEVGIGGIDVTVTGPSGTFNTTTAPDGSWLVTGLAPGDYTVTVDTADIAVLGYGTTPTNQPAASILVAVAAGEDALTADFGFNGGTTGSIGDAVFFDADGDGVQDPGEPGLAGVTLSLFDGAGALVGTAITDSAGGYDFVGLPADTYTVEVTDTRGVLQGLNLSAGSNPTAPILLIPVIDYDLADFGYAPAPGTGSIGNLVWHDLDGNGSFDPGEPGFGGVTLDLWRDENGNGLIEPGIDNFLRTTRTDANGEYELGGLPAGAYVVDVTDTLAVLSGFTQTAGVDPTPVILTPAAPSNFDVDFGYNADDNRTLSGVTFEDVDNDGVLDGGLDIPEAGILLQLFRDLDGDGVLDPQDPPVGATLSIGVGGTYQFTDLAADTYIVVASAAGTILDGYRQTTQLLTSAVQPVDLTAGNSTGNDFGFNLRATLVVISSFRAFESQGAVVVEWVTAAEVRSAGFYLFRWDAPSEQWLSLNGGLLPSLRGAPQGGTYRFVDTGASPWEGHTYSLLELETNGGENTYGPFEVEVEILADPPAMSSSFTSEAHPVPPKMLGRLVRHQQERGKADALRKGRGRGSGGAVKITVREAGLYFLARGELAELFGWNDKRMRAAIKTGDLTLSNRGADVAWTQAAESSGILFYAEEISSPYTLDNVYWLRPGRGAVMDVRTGSGAEPVAGEEGFVEHLHFEEDRFSGTSAPFDPDLGFWFWDFAFAGHPFFGRRPISVTVPAPAAVPAAAELTVALQGLLEGPVSPDYRVLLHVNGVLVGETSWDGIDRHFATLSFDQSLLLEGANLIEVEAVRDPGMAAGLLFVDAFDLTYRRRFEAEADTLVVRTSGEAAVTVTGFSQPEILVFDLTDPERAARLAEVTVSDLGGSYAVSFAAPSGPTRFVTLAEGVIRQGSDAVVDLPVGLTGPGMGADHLVIAPLELVEAAQQLADYRTGQGLLSVVVELEDVYDELNDGIPDPRAIRALLAHAYTNWTPPPRYVVLAGAGSFDYLDRMGLGGNAIPPLLVRTPFGLFASDNVLADVAGDDGVPEIAIGRIPVLAPEELEAYVAKLAAFESDAGGGWRDRVLLVADNSDSGGSFEAASDEVLGLLPPSASVKRLYISEIGAAATRQELLNGLQGGVGWVNYLGHGGLNLMADERILRSSDADGLANAPRLPVLTALTCAVGRFELPGVESLAQALVLQPGGGAVAVWSPTSVSLHADARVLNRALAAAAFAEPGRTVGEVTLEALREYAALARYRFMPFIYSLEGDPAALWRTTP